MAGKKMRGNIPLIILSMLIIVIAGFLVTSCVPTEKKIEEKDTASGDTLTREPYEILYTGYYIEDGEAKYLKKSPDGDYYRVNDETGELSARYAELTFMKAEPVYAAIRGEYEGIESGDSSETKAAINVNEIVEIDYAKRENLLFPFEFRCYGEEPFWALDIIRDDEAIFKDIGRERVYYLAYASPVIEGDVYRFELGESLSGDEGMSVTIERAECVDSMSGEMYEYRGRIEFEGMTYEGCAEAGEGMQG